MGPYAQKETQTLFLSQKLPREGGTILPKENWFEKKSHRAKKA